jgi:hypothetical protein
MSPVPLTRSRHRCVRAGEGPGTDERRWGVQLARRAVVARAERVSAEAARLGGSPPVDLHVLPAQGATPQEPTAAGSRPDEHG